MWAESSFSNPGSRLASCLGRTQPGQELAYVDSHLHPWDRGLWTPCGQARDALCLYSELPAGHTSEPCKAQSSLRWVCFGKLLKRVPIGRDCSCLSSSRVPKPAQMLGNWGTSDHRGGAKLIHQLLIVPQLSPLVCGRGLGVYFAHRILARSTVVPW